MPADLASFFAPDYASARADFLSRAGERGGVLESHPIREPGPAGEELAVDLARFGPDAPRRMLVMSSGLHGVEGHTGSAAQRHLLGQGEGSFGFPADTGLLLIHALNPFGFAHGRRVNEGNVDLNRNFLRHPEDHVDTPDYDALSEHINPSEFDPESDEVHVAALLAYAQEEGFPKLQAVLTSGQYRHPKGVQFGGTEAQASNRILRDVAKRHAGSVESLAWVDIHTGLGPYTEVEMITEVEPSDPAYGRGRAWYGERAKSTRSGESVSAALHGVMENGIEASIDPDCELTIYAAEFGTYDPLRVFRAMRADNWLEHHGDPESDQGRAIKKEILEVFRPADSAWQSQVLHTASEIFQSTRQGLCGS